MAEDWSTEEVAATVTDYLEMLRSELRGEPFNKKEHNRRLQTMLKGRSASAIEFKHQNISAVLIELGLPYIDGYKPARNYQALLKNEVLTRLNADTTVEQAADVIVHATIDIVPRPGENPFVPPPKRERAAGPVYEKRNLPSNPRRGVNYLEREAHNASLGMAGELFVMSAEHERLWRAGERRLAERVEHVAQSLGDGLGYDIVSFETNGRERLIEVKTTNFGIMTPFFASRREVLTSEEKAPLFNLYRVFRFRDEPKIFVLAGSMKESCILDPVQYRASVL